MAGHKRNDKAHTPLRAAGDFAGLDQDSPDTAGVEHPVRPRETPFMVLVSGAICFVALRTVVVSNGRLEALAPSREVPGNFLCKFQSPAKSG